MEHPLLFLTFRQPYCFRIFFEKIKINYSVLLHPVVKWNGNRSTTFPLLPLRPDRSEGFLVSTEQNLVTIVGPGEFCLFSSLFIVSISLHQFIVVSIFNVFCINHIFRKQKTDGGRHEVCRLIHGRSFFYFTIRFMTKLRWPSFVVRVITTVTKSR